MTVWECVVYAHNNKQVISVRCDDAFCVQYSVEDAYCFQTFYFPFWMYDEILSLIRNAFNSVTWKWKTLYVEQLHAVHNCELIPESSLTSLRIFQTYRIFGEQTCIRECERIGVSVCACAVGPSPSLLRAVAVAAWLCKLLSNQSAPALLCPVPLLFVSIADSPGIV